MNNKNAIFSPATPKNIVTLLCLATVLFTNTANRIIANNKECVSYKTFEIVIPSFNNERWAETNLRSVCFQNYPKDKYHITYINDASTDKTKEVVTTFVKQNHLEKQVTLINNTCNKGQMENRYRAFHALPDTTIIAECDGDDFYAHNDVLQELNARYQNPNTWMLYTPIFKTFPGNRIVTQPPFTTEEINNNTLRNFHGKPTCQLRSYYAWLFKRIKLKDLLYEGRFYTILTDPAYMIPMLEMAGTHNECVDKILYLYNTSNPLCVRKKYDLSFREKIYADISNKTPYNRLITPAFSEASKHTHQPELIICCTKLSSLNTLITTAQEKLSGFSICQVFLELKNKQQIEYQPATQLPFKFQLTTYDAHDFTLQKALQTHLIQSASSAFALLTNETVSINNHINLSECLNTLADSFAPIFYLHDIKNISQNQTPLVQIKPSVWAGQFKYLEAFHKPGALLCTKEFFLTKLSTMHINTLDELNRDIASWAISSNDVCLFFHNEDK